MRTADQTRPHAADPDETLRETLIELAVLREREAAARRESEALLDGVAAMNAAGSPDRALAALLASVRASLDCDAAALLAAESGRAAIREATDPALVGLAPPAFERMLSRSMRVPDAAAAEGWTTMPAPLRPHRALVAAPFALPDGDAGAILCLARAPGAFAPAHQRLLRRLSALAAQALATLALAERNALLAAVIDGSSASVSIADATDPELPLVYVNDAFTALTGHPRSAVLGRNCRFLAADPPDSEERRRLREATAARAAGDFMLRNRRRDGRVFWNRLTLVPVRDPRGRVTHLVATQTDATAEREAAEERDAARRRMIAALSATSEGFLLLDREGRVVFANPAWRAFFDPGRRLFADGASAPAAWAARLVERGLPEDAAREAARARLDALLAGGSEREEALEDGRILLVRDRPTEDGGGVCLATDVTGLKATERALAQRAAAIDAAQDGVAVTDLDGRFVYMNPAHLAMFGYAREDEIRGLHWSALYEREALETIEREVTPGLASAGRWKGEIVGSTRLGAPIEQEISLTQLDGIGVVCVTRDVGARKRAERERARLADQLAVAQRQEAVGQLAAGVAHDFNNLLSVIGASGAMLRACLSAETEEAEPVVHLSRILAAAERAGGLVRGLMDLGARRGEMRRVDLRTIVHEAADLLRAGVPSRVRLEVSLPDSPVEVEADPTELLQVLLNLGINGRDALGEEAGGLSLRLSPGGPPEAPGDVRVGALVPGRRYARLEVADTGAGMDEATRARIFRPYFTTKGENGTGLGLVVVSSVVAKVGGAVGVASAPGQGSRFVVHWPLEPVAPPDPAVAASPTPAPADARAAAPAPAVPALPPDLAARPVLVCDDLPEVGRALGDLLESLGVEVAVCTDPEDALAALREDPGGWSLLVTDYDMPGATGTEVAAAARAAAPDLPVILCSAWADALREAGPVDVVLAKPATPAALAAAVKRAFDARARQRASRPTADPKPESPAP